MSLFTEWKELIDHQTEETYTDFWKDYSGTEKRIYIAILGDYKTKISDTFGNLAAKYEATDVLFMGFLDGINTSLLKELKLEKMTAASKVTLDIDFEKLYFNMLNAGADYLYELPQWKSILTDERMAEITKDYKKSKTVVKGEQIGRNDPCPCGSGKKYKKCCGA
jgi:hypothetical protein